MPSSCEVDGLRKELKATQAALELSTGREAALKRELEETQASMRRAQERLAQWQLYCASMEDRQLTVKVLTGLSECYFYTGLPSYSVFEGLYTVLAGGMPRSRKGPEPILDCKEQFFLVLVRLRTGMPLQEVARNFGVTVSLCSKLFSKWIVYLQKALRQMTRFPSLKQVQKQLPHHFREFPDTRIVIDGTEVKIQTPSSMEAQKLTYSPYKHANTIKFLVGATPDGYVSFVSKVWGGSVSDRQMVIESGLLSLLEPGDAIMMDKGFTIFDVLPDGVKGYMPPFNKPSQGQMTANNVIKTRKIARARVHIERVIRRIKEFHILDSGYPVNMADVGNAVVQTCAFLSNFKNPIV
ncbi:uncharacterized protein LOC144149430 [Haemaphysalis longicornis]